LQRETRKIISSLNIPLRGPLSDEPGRPIINDKKIAFNGVEDEGNESFVLTKRGFDFEFCKTARKEYDAVVVEVLKAAREVNPDIELSSDGGPEVFQ